MKDNYFKRVDPTSFNLKVVLSNDSLHYDKNVVISSASHVTKSFLLKHKKTFFKIQFKFNNTCFSKDTSRPRLRSNASTSFFGKETASCCSSIVEALL